MINLNKVLSSLIIFPLIVTSNWNIKTWAAEYKTAESEFLIWKIAPQAESTYSVYILGSYHVDKNCKTKPGAFEFTLNSANFWYAFNKAKTIYFEIEHLKNTTELSRKSQLYTRELINKYGTASSPSESLKGILDAHNYTVLQEKAAAMNFPLENYAHQKPWVFLHAYESFQLRQTEYKSQCGLDNIIELLAQIVQKDTEGLESLDYQINQYIDSLLKINPDKIRQTLLEIVNVESTDKLLDNYIQEIEFLINTVNAGDSQALASYINDWCAEDTARCESLLYARNRHWLPKIEQSLQQNQDSLVVVGAGHLVGEQSLIQLLKQKGYRVKRLYNGLELTEE